jgi:CheY-like chemotaxis protein
VSWQERILDDAGYRVFEAANGDDAERVFAQHADSIDLVVTDVMMAWLRWGRSWSAGCGFEHPH